MLSFDDLDGVLSNIYDSGSSNTMKFSFLDRLNLDGDVINRLSRHLSNIVTGYDTSIVTPIGKSIDPAIILSRWDKIYENNKTNIIDTLDKLEKLNRSKFGSRSIAKPWSIRKESTFEYFDDESCAVDINQPSLKGTLRPISVPSAVKCLKNTTNSGLPFYVKKGEIKSEVLRNFDSLLKRKDPCILFTRTQEGNKTRDVFGYPVADTVNENRFYRPTLSYQVSLEWRSALKGPLFVDKQITEMINLATKRGYLLVSIDFSGYDKSLKRTLQDASFTYIKNLFQKKYHKEIDYIRDRFNTIGLVTPSGVLSGMHGVPSGSTFTNEVDSISQYLLVKDHVLSLQVQGDDGAYVIKSLSDFNKLKSILSRAGLVVNEEKSYISKEYVVYLQCLYHKHYINNNLIGGIYPIYRALNRIVYQENWNDFEDYGLEGNDYYSIRTISILENCKHHPLFREFVLFVKSLDKYALRFSEKSISKYNRMYIDGKGTGGVINNQYGDDIRGIRSFEAYKIINS